MDNPNDNITNPYSPTLPVVEEEVPVVEEEVPLVEEVPIVEEVPVVEEETVVTPMEENMETEEEEPLTTPENSNQQIPLTADKATLGMLCQNLNANLLVTSSAYKAILSNLKENITNEEKQKALEENIEELEKIEEMLSELLVSVQNNLEIETDKVINPQLMLEEARGSGKFMQTLLNTEAIAILAAMLAPIGLGGGNKRKKKTKRLRNKGEKMPKKKTKKASKI